ncbi:MAG: putative methylase [Anaeromyxobacteraceae bacterium]|nr:putative methylase [Anaeromyxobacteraceae bacterium]
MSRGAPRRVFAACSPGLEPALARELDALGLSARTVAGGAEAEGRDAWALACLGSRAADAVKARLWEGPPSGAAEARRDLARHFPGVDLEARREGERATLSADAAGAPLFKRGWRARVGAAPLRESLAAGLLLELGFDGSVPFLDPMCGSRLAALSRDPPAPVVASDRNGGAVRLAGKNAEAAGMAGVVRIERRDARDVEPPPGPGVCLVNPPYGIRLDREVEESWRSLGWLLGRLSGWTVGVLAGDPALARLLPGKPARSLEVQNGGIRCRFLVYQP